MPPFMQKHLSRVATLVGKKDACTPYGSAYLTPFARLSRFNSRRDRCALFKDDQRSPLHPQFLYFFEKVFMIHMHRFFSSLTIVASSLISLSALAENQTPYPNTALTLKRVSLSSSGVGYFEYEAQVRGHAVLALPVALDKVDDVLKSLVVYDKVGTIGGVILPGLDPHAQALKLLPFEASALTHPAALFEALRGAQVSLPSSKTQRAMRGRIVSVSAMAGLESQPLRHQVMLLTDTGMQQFVLEQAQDVQFEEAALREPLAKALAALSNSRAKDVRTVEISSQSSNSALRTVRVGYVTSVPIWKNAYRVTLPYAAANSPPSAAAPAAAAQVQGWAVVENMSGQDWTDVELTLTAGKPVAFSQQIYRSYYNTRPEVGVTLPGHMMPITDAGALPMADTLSLAPSSLGNHASPVKAQAQLTVAAMATAPASPLTSRMNKDKDKAASAAPSIGLAAVLARPPQIMGAPLTTAGLLDLPVTSDESTQTSYTFGLPVTVGRGRSLSIPIIQTALPMQRVALYQPNTGGQYPLAAVVLENNTANGLPPGAATLYEQWGSGSQFVGDAQLSGLPAQDKRYMAYAVDQKIVMAHTDQQHQQLLRYFVRGAGVYGDYLNVSSRTFTLRSTHADTTPVVVEVPKQAQPFTLSPSATGEFTQIGTTADVYRLNIMSKPGETRSVRVEQSHPSTQHRFGLATIAADALRPYLESPAVDAASKPILEKVLTLRLRLEQLNKDWGTASAALTAAREEQSRIQTSLNAVPARSASHKTYLNQLQATDAQEANANKEVSSLLLRRQAAERALNEYVAALK